MKNALYTILVIVFFIVLVFVAYKDNENKQACFDSGGWVNEYNCTEHGCSWRCIHD